MCEKKIPPSVQARLPIYLHFLRGFLTDGNESISSAALAKNLDFGEVQVRKDLALVSGAGKPRIGYRTNELIAHIEEALGSRNETNAVVVGAGRLGMALLNYEGFVEFGLHLIVAFDRDETKISEKGQKPILPLEKMEDFCKRNDVRIGVICVPEKEASSACEKLVSCGVSAIWNFAPVRLRTSEKIRIKNENMAATLAVLAANI